MSTRTTTYQSSTTSRTNRLSGIPSGVILFFSIFVPVVWAIIDIGAHGHFRCRTLLAVAQSEINRDSHLKEYIEAGKKDYAGQDENGVVTCECNEKDRKITIKGNVTNEEIRQQFSDAAASAVGTNMVDNQLHVCNIAALEELKNLLATPPTNMVLNYVVRDRCTIVLTGDLPDPALKEKVGMMVSKVEGVRSVVNLLGKEAKIQETMVVRNIYFDFNKWTIRPESQAGLDESTQKVEDFLAGSPQGTIRVIGHTDSIASTQYNQWLSEKRAQAVLEALVNRGIPADRLKAEGKGESQLVASPDNTPETRAENRRIEFRFEK